MAGIGIVDPGARCVADVTLACRIFFSLQGHQLERQRLEFIARNVTTGRQAATYAGQLSRKPLPRRPDSHPHRH